MATDAPKLYELVTIGVKTETDTGVAETIANTDCDIVVENPQWQTDPAIIERQYPGALGQFKSQPSVAPCTVTFTTRLVNGASGAPDWLTALLAASDMTLTGSVYNCVRGESSVTLAEWRDGIKRVAYGMRFNPAFNFVNGQPARIDWTGLGVFTDETADTPPANIVLPTANAPLVDGTTLTYAAATPQGVSSVVIDRGNTLVMREDVTRHGYRGAAITLWKPTITIDPEMVALATRDWNALRLAASEAAFAFSIGDAANNTFAFAAAAAQVQSAPIINVDGKMKQSVVLQANGSNPLTLTLS
jgi:hypothetical protein